MDNYIKELANSTPNDAELGAKVRKYVDNNKTCCNKVGNEIMKRTTYTTVDDESIDIYCKACGKFIRHA